MAAAIFSRWKTSRADRCAPAFGATVPLRCTSKSPSSCAAKPSSKIFRDRCVARSMALRVSLSKVSLRVVFLVTFEFKESTGNPADPCRPAHAPSGRMGAQDMFGKFREQCHEEKVCRVLFQLVARLVTCSELSLEPNEILVGYGSNLLGVANLAGNSRWSHEAQLLQLFEQRPCITPKVDVGKPVANTGYKVVNISESICLIGVPCVSCRKQLANRAISRAAQMTEIDEHALFEFREKTTQRFISQIVLNFIPYMGHHTANLNFTRNAINIGVRSDKVRGRQIDFEVSRSIEAVRIILMLVAHIWSYLGSAITRKSTAKSSGDLVFVILLVRRNPHCGEVSHLLEDRVNVRHFF